MRDRGRTPADGWAEDFSYGYYRTLLHALRAAFELRTLSERLPGGRDGERTAFLRHDVDVCLERAVELAEIEHELGVRSTYMVLPDTPLYNLEENRDVLHHLCELGHEIGLHCDLGPAANGAEPTDGGLTAAEHRRITDGRRRLAALDLRPVRSVSFHRPAGRVLGGPRRIDGMVNAYAADLLASYVSDSSGRWREGNPVESVVAAADTEVDRLQVLTHPVWWGPEHEPPLERFSAVADGFDDLDQRIYDELVSIYGAYGERTDRIVA